MDADILVTSPLIPPLEQYTKALAGIWDSRWMTNNGPLHQQLERALEQKLGVEHISLFTNGTLPLITAFQALRITGEVITTPYSFVATTHSLWWNGIKPVFVDVDPLTGNLDPARIEAAITPKTTAILPVHVYGQPCDTAAIGAIADKYGLRVIYDAAHAFGVEVGGRSILREGDMSTLSFHATKVYSTVEGGALVMPDAKTKQRIDYLKNFGFAGETEVVGPGINSKLDEMRAAYGLLNLEQVDAAIARRRHVAERYRAELDGIAGLSWHQEQPGVRYNYGYFPVYVDAERFGMSRDDLYELMRRQRIFGRRYFYPLISEFAPYRGLPSADPANLPVAHRLARQVICLPIHHELTDADTDRVIAAIRSAYKG